jgi:hypothetical protein
MMCLSIDNNFLIPCLNIAKELVQIVNQNGAKAFGFRSWYDFIIWGQTFLMNDHLWMAFLFRKSLTTCHLAQSSLIYTGNH